MTRRSILFYIANPCEQQHMTVERVKFSTALGLPPPSGPRRALLVKGAAGSSAAGVRVTRIRRPSSGVKCSASSSCEVEFTGLAQNSQGWPKVHRAGPKFTALAQPFDGKSL